MRILINDIAASKRGALTILDQVYRYAMNHSDSDEWIFLTGVDYLTEKKSIKIVCLPEIKKNRFKKLYFDFISGHSFIEKYNPDVVLSLQNIITFGLKIPQFVYIHQSIPYQDIKRFSFLKSSERNYAVYQYLIGSLINLSARRANGVVVQTDWMKEAVANKAHIEKEKIEVCFPDVDKIEQVEKCSYQQNMFFYPTSIAVYKNNDLITEACNILNRKGINDFKVYMTLPENAIKHPNIECIGVITREEVFTYYQKANLIFPSYIETIGLPLLEAKSVNSFILAAKCAYADNILADYSKALLFDPFDPNQLAELMERVMTEPPIKDEIIHERDRSSEWEKAFQFIKSRRQ